MDYTVPTGYKIVGIEIIHTGSHMLMCFGTNFGAYVGTVPISAYCTNITGNNLENVAPQLRLILAKIY